MPIIIARNINKSFKIKENIGNHVLRNISIDIERNKITTLMGASGVGKSTLLYMLGTIDKPDSGEIILHTANNSFEYSKLSPTDLAMLRNRHIGFVFQFHHLLPEFTVLENIIMPALISGVSQKKAEKRGMELMERVGITNIAQQKPNEISGGEQQRSAIVRSIMNLPEIVFADEPTGNLDSQNAANVMQLIKALNADLGITFLIATHSSDVANMSDKIMHMKDGIIH